MTLRDWTNVEKVLRRYAPILAREYSKEGNLDRVVSFTVEDLQIELDLPSYWEYIEYGRGPGRFPPINKIEDWIRKKNIIPKTRNGITPTSTQLAYLIGRKISEKGTKGKHALEDSLEDIENKFINDLYLAVVEDVKNQII